MLAADVAPNRSSLVELRLVVDSMFPYNLCSKISSDLPFIENMSIVGGQPSGCYINLQVSITKEMYYAIKVGLRLRTTRQLCYRMDVVMEVQEQIYL